MLHALLALALQVAPPLPPQADTSRIVTKVVDSVPGSRRPRREAKRIPVTAEHERTAFLDAPARVLLHRARAARLTQDSLLRSYDATTYQRMSFGMALRALARERLALREESSGRVRWMRGRGMHVTLTGSRAVMPIAGKGGQYRADIDMTPIPYFPGRESLFPLSAFGTVRADVDEENFVHPLANGAEAYYRYRTGASQTIVLPNRERITVRELEITARRPEWKLLVGSFWFDDRTGQLVRAAYRISEPLDIWNLVDEETAQELRDIEGDTALRRKSPAEWEQKRKAKAEDDEVPLAVKAMFNPAKFDISAITTEYELVEGRFWMPRANYAEGTMQMGFVRSPFKVEEKFTYLAVNGLDSMPTAVTLAMQEGVRDSARRAERDSLRAAGDSTSAGAQEDFDGEINISIGGGTPDTAAMRRRRAADTTAAGRRRALRRAERERQCAATGSYTRTVERFDGSLRYPVSVPCDSTQLFASADLPKSIYDDGEEMFDERSRDDLLKTIDFGLQPGLMARAPVKPYWGLNLVRYNRVEGLSSAVGARWAPGGGWAADGQLRIGTADLEPNAELIVTRSNARATLGLGAYRRLAAANDRGDPLSFGSSVSAFLFGRDEGFYYRTAGLELTGRRGRFGQLGWRLFTEHHGTAKKETDYSLAKTFAGNDLLDDIDAREGVIAGAVTTLGFSRGLDPRGWRLAGDWRAEGAAGEFAYARSALDATVSHALGGGAEAAVTGAGGYSAGDLPPQRLWYLGGAQTVRGQVAGTQRGDAFWLGRAELARSWPIMRPVLFGDVGWAGDRKRLFDRPGQLMSGAGIGASFLDGLVRFDVSRGIRPVQMWRVDMYLEARF